MNPMNDATKPVIAKPRGETNEFSIKFIRGSLLRTRHFSRLDPGIELLRCQKAKLYASLFQC